MKPTCRKQHKQQNQCWAQVSDLFTQVLDTCMSDVGTGSSTEASQGEPSASANTVFAKASPGTKRIARVRKRHLGMLQTMLEASRRAAEFVTSVRYSCSVRYESAALLCLTSISCSEQAWRSVALYLLPSACVSSGDSNIKYQLLGHAHACKCNAASQDPLQCFCVIQPCDTVLSAGTQNLPFARTACVSCCH